MVVPSDGPKHWLKWTSRVHPQCLHGYMASLIPEHVGTRETRFQRCSEACVKTKGMGFCIFCMCAGNGVQTNPNDGCSSALLSIGQHPSQTIYSCFYLSLYYVNVVWNTATGPSGPSLRAENGFCLRLFDVHARKSTHLLNTKAIELISVYGWTFCI